MPINQNPNPSTNPRANAAPSSSSDDPLRKSLSISDRSRDSLPRARSRSTLEGQRIEIQLANKILNTTIRLGMPDSHRVA